MSDIQFLAVCPVLPVTDLARSIEFWEKLGFACAFVDADSVSTASYAVVQRGAMALHMQTFTPEQMVGTQTMATRIVVDDVDRLNAEWEPHGVITAPLGDRPWGNREFGFYDPDGTPFFFYSDIV